jgi:hypothetical protein
VSARGWVCLVVVLTGCGSHQLSAGAEDTGTESGTMPDLPDPDPPSCDGAPPQAVVAGPVAEAPVSSSSGKMFWQPDSQRLILFGGLRFSGEYSDAVLEIDPVTLANRLLDWAAGPTFELTSVSAAEDPYQPRWWFVGGNHGQGLEAEVLEVRLSGDVLTATQLPAMPSEPVDHGVGYDPESGRLLYVLGWDGHGEEIGYPEETWVLRPDAGNPQWQLLAGAGGPLGQRDADLVYVPNEGLFMLALVDPDNSYESGIWQLQSESEVWEQRAIALPTPSHLGRARLFWDEPSCRLLLWTDGYFTEDGLVPAMWVIDPFTEPMIAVELPRPQPATTYGRNAGYDPVHRIVLEHGGADFDVIPSIYPKTVESFTLD